MIARTFSALSMIALLSACGGSGGGPVLQDPDGSIVGDGVSAPLESGMAENPSEEFGERFGDADTADNVEETDPDESELGETLEASEEKTISLTGIAFLRNVAPGTSSVELQDGIYTESTKARTLDGQTIRLTGDVSGEFTQASSFLNDTAGAVGIIGIATSQSAIPEDGRATFRGGASGLVVIGDNGFELRNGRSTIIADFDGGTIEAELDRFNSYSTVSGNELDAPFESINLDGALISGSSFAGGVITTGGGDSVADVIGDNTSAVSQGQFYGETSDGRAPGEVGGVIFTEGDDGLIYGSFIGAN